MRTFLIALLLAIPITAAEPGLELRLRPAADFVAQFEYVGKLVGQAEQAKQFAEVVDAFGGKKGVIEGVDMKRPVGAYVVFTPNMADSQVVVMLPIANEKAFINLLTNRLTATPEKQDDGSYFVQLPKVPVPLYFRFHKEYACIGVQDAKHVLEKNLIDPKEFFKAEQTDLIAFKLHVDKLPAEVRKQFTGQFELALADKLAKDKPKNAAEDLTQWLAADGLVRAMKATMDEGRTLALTVGSDPKTDDLGVTLALTAKDGSALKSTFAGLANKPAHAALAGTAKAPVASLLVNGGIPEAMKKEFAKRMDEMLNEGVQNAGDGGMVVEKAFEALAATLKAGDFEIGAALTGSGPGSFKLVAAMRMIEAKGLEKLIKDFAGFIPVEAAKIDFDEMKTSKGNIHKVTVGEEAFKTKFGTDKAWALLGDSLFVAGIEADGAETKRIAEAKPATSPVLAVKLAARMVLTFTEHVHDAETHAATMKSVFGSKVADDADEMSLTVTGGESLSIKLNVKGKAIQFLTETSKRKAKRD